MKLLAITLKILLLFSFISANLVAADLRFELTHTQTTSHYKLVAIDTASKKALGFIEFSTKESSDNPNLYGDIDDLLVEEAARRKGIGSYLFSEAIRHLDTIGVQRTDWFAQTDDIDDETAATSQQRLNTFYTLLGGLPYPKQPQDSDGVYFFFDHTEENKQQLATNAPPEISISSPTQKNIVQFCWAQVVRNDQALCTLSFDWQDVTKSFELKSLTIHDNLLVDLISQICQLIADQLQLDITIVESFLPPEDDESFDYNE